ncbi:MAG TPA: AMP-binding protein, partial [Capillimicrobium sp.]|nr:AMP-binding protein [Capillimicrobium sp.]
MSVSTPPVLWTPTPEQVEQTTLTRFTRWLEAREGRRFDTYADLWQWSIDDIDAFWASIWEFFDVRASEPYELVLGRREMPGAEWFPGARLNYAEHVFRGKDDAAVALRHAAEERPLQAMTWGELRTLTARIAAGLRAQGVGPGDRVVAYLPNGPEAMAAMLAAASLGAIWSSCSPDFGARSVVDRFAQIEPAVLLAVGGYRYGGRWFDRREVVAGLMEQMPSLRATVLLGDEPLDGTIPWDDFLAD